MPVSLRFRRTSASRRPARTLAVAAAAVGAVLVVAGCSDAPDDAASIVRTTTNIAGAGVVGTDRDTATACPLPSAPDTTGGTRAVTHTAGVAQVPADPQRIVVLSAAALDAACALGLWERVVGASTLPGPRPQPMYLGTGVLEVPSVGVLGGQPDPAQIAALKPDLILGDVAPAAGYDALAALAPTVLVGGYGSWQSDFAAYAAGMNRATAARAALDAYLAEARDTGIAINASQSQASVLRFSPTATQVQGADTFAAQVLSDTGVQRPTAQRAGSFDIPAGELDTEAEGDIIYVMFDSAEGEDHGKKVMRSDEWKKLGAATDRRVFAVDDTVWHAHGLTAARAVVTDLRRSLNGYVTD
ncbi:ABC transporter substrate-binding protein [Nocardia thailandica]